MSDNNSNDNGSGPVEEEDTNNRFGPPQWNGAENEALLAARPEFVADESREPTGEFLKEYLYFVEQLGILPHPDLFTVKQPPARVFTEDGEFVEEEDDEEADAEEPEQPTAISIRNNYFDTATMKAVCLALPGSTQITHLKLYNAGLTADSIDVLAAALANSSVTSLYIEYNPLSPGDDDSDPSLKFASLVDLPLVALWLRGNAISADGAKALAEKLFAHTTLNSLNLFDNQIGADGALVSFELRLQRHGAVSVIDVSVLIHTRINTFSCDTGFN